MRKTLLIHGVKGLFEVRRHLDRINIKKWTDSRYHIHCSEHTYRAFYNVGSYRFDTIYIVRFSTRVTELWVDAQGNRVNSEKKCIESFFLQ